MISSPTQNRIIHAKKFAGGVAVVLSLACLPAGPVPCRAQKPSESYRYTGQIHFDVKRVPFSRFGSYLGISDLSGFAGHDRREGLFLRTMHQGGKTAFHLEMTVLGQVAQASESATPTLLTLSSGDSLVEISFQGPDRLRIRGHHAGLRLTATEGWVVQYPGDHLELNTGAMKYMIFPIKGRLDQSSVGKNVGPTEHTISLSPADNAEDFEAELDAYTSGWNAHETEGSFDEAQAAERLAYEQWLSKMPKVDAEFGPGAELAAYVEWESVVAASGNLKRPAMLMSKNWMESVWSWDHAFNAIAMSEGDAAFAWDQFLLPFDVQDAEGALPDKWDADTIAWEFSKPPIHGWALTQMFRLGRFQDARSLQEIYPLLAKWTEWYFQHRDSNHNGLPEYRHGDESGWDNSTVFEDGTPIETPDLSALLSIQMQVLAEIAARLGKADESARWQQRSDELLAKLLARFWRDGEFVAVRASDGGPIHSESLILSIPIVLGMRLPAEVRSQLVASLKKRAASSKFGLATEPFDSPFYESDGYWRGPIWAPSTMLIATGLDEIGEREFAASLKREFCTMAQQNGMAENFDARSGAALRDPAYTWTSSVFLIFANELSKR